MRQALRKIARGIRLMPELADVQVRYGLLQRFLARPFLPRMLLFVSTHTCNARCSMCGIWKDREASSEELSLGELREILQDRLFSRLKYIGINGGEPFLRPDLFGIVELLQSRCPQLKRISITTNGLATRQIESQIGKIAEVCQDKGVLLDISVSCHALGPLADRIFGVSRAFDRTLRSLELLKSYQHSGKVTLSLNCVLLKDNLENASKLLNWAREQDIGISFVVGERRQRFRNEEMGDAFIQDQQKAALLAFLASVRAGHGRSPDGLRYRALEAVISGRPRTVSCQYSLAGLLLGFDGRLYYCPHSGPVGNCRERAASEIFYDPRNLRYRTTELLKGQCLRCPPYTSTRLELEKDIRRVIMYLLSTGRHTAPTSIT